MNEVSLKPVIEELENLFSKFNARFFADKLEKPVITVSPDHTRGAYGWCTGWKAWKAGEDEGHYEINLCAEYLNRPFEETCGTLIHEMVHLQNLQDGVQDTSRSGTYHNKKFKETAEAHGLTVEKGEKYGWHKTALSPEALEFVQSLGKQGFTLVRPRPIGLMAYKMYLDGVLMPITPSKVKVKINNQNETLTLISGEEINILKAAGLTDVSFDLLLPQVPYPFTNGGAQPADYYLSLFERLKTAKEPFQWILNREKPNGSRLFYTNLTVGMEDYQITDDAEEGFDITVAVSLKQYRHYSTKTVTIQPAPTPATKPTATVEPPKRETSQAPKQSTYTVKSGDCLWNIAKKYLGDGSRYNEIYNLNKDKIKNPNLIYAGQVLTLPS